MLPDDDEEDDVKECLHDVDKKWHETGMTLVGLDTDDKWPWNSHKVTNCLCLITNCLLILLISDDNDFRMAYALSKEIFVVGAKRTAFGAFGGTLKGHTANDLQTIANVAALKSANVDPTLVDTTCVGNVMQSSADAAYLAR